jgi:hypothetical protein
LLGPIIGVLAAFVVGSIADLFSRVRFSQIPWSPWHMMVAVTLYVVPFAYLFGGLQATLVGVVAAWYQRRHPQGAVPLVPILVASVLSMPTMFVMTKVQRSLSSLAIVLGLHLAAGFVCWAIANTALCSWRRGILPADSKVPN